MPDPKPQLIEIRKYPNRRYYDSTHSRHLTLEQIRALIEDGHEVHVTDSSSSMDITGKVLTQILLELDSWKLELFPAPFLSQLIRVKDQLFFGFFQNFFGQAVAAFLQYQRQFEAQMRPGGALPALFPPFSLWSQNPFNPFPQPGQPPPQSGEGEVAETLRRLQEQVAELQEQLRVRDSKPR